MVACYVEYTAYSGAFAGACVTRSKLSAGLGTFGAGLHRERMDQDGARVTLRRPALGIAAERLRMRTGGGLIMVCVPNTGPGVPADAELGAAPGAAPPRDDDVRPGTAAAARGEKHPAARPPMRQRWASTLAGAGLLLGAGLLSGAGVLSGATGAQATMIGPLDLGEAGDLGITFYALSGSMRASPVATVINGHLGLGDGVAAAKVLGSFGASISGTFYADPLALVPPSRVDDPVVMDLSGAATTLRNAAMSAALMTPTQSLGNIRLTGGGNDRITATAPVNVVQTGRIRLSGGSTLVFEGAADQVFIVNAEDLDLTGGSRIILEGGLSPGNVLFNVRNDVRISSSSLDGYLFCMTFVTPSDAYKCDQTTIHSSTVNGALFAESLRASSGARVNFVAATSQSALNEIAEPAALALLGFGLLGLTAARRRRT